MKNFSNFSISKILTSALVILLLPVVIYYFYKEIKIIDKNTKASFEEDLVEFVGRINRRWYHGDIERQWEANKLECADIPNDISYRNTAFLQCNPTYLKCWLADNNGRAKTIKTKSHQFQADLSSIRLDDKGNLLVDFLELNSKRSFSLKLEKNCHQTYLPNKVYSSGPDANSEDIWDNYGREIYIDQYYVTKSDIKQWKTNSLKIDADGILPALDLTISERKNYCNYRGKKLLQNHIFEAASFYPTKFKEGHIFKSKYPWAKVDKIKREKKTSESDCEKIFTIECGENKFYQSFENYSPSWIGIYHILGGHMEIFENIYDKNANLKVSNYVLGRTSFWHQNSRRAYWKGQSLGQSSFDFTEYYTKQNSQIISENIKGVAFRCMSIR